VFNTKTAVYHTVKGDPTLMHTQKTATIIKFNTAVLSVQKFASVPKLQAPNCRHWSRDFSVFSPKNFDWG